MPLRWTSPRNSPPRTKSQNALLVKSSEKQVPPLAPLFPPALEDSQGSIANNFNPVLITGASPGGIGAASALSLALGSPKQLIVAGRSPEKLAATISEVKAVNPSVEVIPLELDLLSLKQVDRAAKALLEKVPVIDILINNAGIMAPPYELSEDGIESQFAVNHLAHFHLTRVLLPALQRSPGRGRVINVSSAGHRLGPVRLDDWNFSDGKTYDKWEGYGQSKSANVLFSVALKKRGDVGEAFAIHPGTVSTHLLKEHAKADIESTCKWTI